ncbi:MAG: hypothetical protein QOE34_624 [Verrucomicrobiota bacterium]|jgi:Ni/Fe-hydrogenase subunit HybB-like protein
MIAQPPTPNPAGDRFTSGPNGSAAPVSSAGFSGETVAEVLRRRRRRKLLFFIVGETLALALMLGAAIAGISERFVAESLTPLFRILPIIPAGVAVILPIVFFGDPKKRNRARFNRLAASGSPMHQSAGRDL